MPTSTPGVVSRAFRYITEPLKTIGAGAVGSLFERAANSLDRTSAEKAAEVATTEGGFVGGVKKGLGIALDIGRAIVSSAVGVTGKVLGLVGAGALGDQFAKSANFMDPSTDKPSSPAPLRERASTAMKDFGNFAVDVGRAALSSALNMVGWISKNVFRSELSRPNKTSVFSKLADWMNPSTDKPIAPLVDTPPTAAAPPPESSADPTAPR